MIVAKLRLLNWLRYSGEHLIELNPTVYGLTAQYVGDARRSNWAGKTSLIEAIRFGLYGLHRAAREDGWITNGNDFGQVTLWLSNGYSIERSRRRGQATKLTLNLPDGGIATGDEAQRQIEQIVGLSSDDFDVTCWFGQKQLARLINAKPVERFGLVSGWFGLEGLQRCEDSARARLASLTAQSAAHAATEQRAKDDIARLAARWMPSSPGIWPTLSDLQSALEQARDRATKAAQNAETAVCAAKLAVDAVGDARRVRADAARFTSIVAEGRALTDQIDIAYAEAEDAEELREAYLAARTEWDAAHARLDVAKQLARGQFDGRCPVAGMECPSTREINAATTRNAQLFEEAEQLLATASAEHSRTAKAAEAARVAATTVRMLVAKQTDLRKQAMALKPAADAVKAGSVPSATELDATTNTLQQAERQRAEANADLRDIDSALNEVAAIARRLDEVKDDSQMCAAELALARAAVRILGRQGAQQRIAESALAEIEAGANAMLREAGIDLSITVRWAREGTGLASACNECAAPFPASAKVRKCACGAERGPKMIERLDIELSDRSGAAEDLAGAALQLAAAAWLRRERDVQWSVALIDEPFGALDEANRKSFAAHLTAMLRGRHGFSQAFIVAHHPDVVDGLPARVTVTADERGSALEVAS